MEPVHLTLFLLAISVQGIMALNPCNKTFTGKGTVLPGEIPQTMKNCTFNFSINANETLMLVFSSLGSLGSGDNIIIIAGPNVNTSIVTRNDPVTVVSTSGSTVVTFQRGSKSEKNGNFRLDYNNVCEQDVYPSSGYLASPKYLIVTKKNIECQYTVMNPEGQITLLEFAAFTLNSSILTVNGTEVTAGNKKLPNDLLMPTNTTIVLNVTNPETAGGFSSILSPVDNSCSNPAFNVSNPFSYTSSSAAVCHLMINGSSGTLVATVKSWQTNNLDQLQFRDGFSQDDNVLTSGSPVKPDIVLASSGSLMSVHLLFEPTSKERNVSISFTSQDYGGLVKVGESIMYDSAKSGGKDGVFQCTLDAVKKVSLTTFNMTNNGKVEVYDGNLITGAPLFTIMNTSLPIPVFVKTNQMTIVTKYSSSNYTFRATTGEAQASDQFSQPGLGSYQVISSGPNDTNTYNLIILPLPNGDYRGTIQLSSLTLCVGDKVTIFEGITTITAQKKLVEFTNDSTLFIPQYIFAADKGAWIVTALSKCEGRKAGDVVVTASYDVKTLDFLCGKSPSNPNGIVTSPYYPLRYPLNLNCKCTFENKTDSFLYISVDQLSITDGNSLKLTGNIPEFSFPADKTIGRDLIFNKNKDLTLSFNTESQNGTLVLPGEGFEIKYNYLDCGGSVNTSFNASLGGTKKDCRWIISLPNTAQDSVVSVKTVYIIDAKLGVTANYVAGSLIVYDSTNMTDMHRVNLTNLTDTKMLTFKSRVDTFIIQYLNNATAKEFTLTVNINKYPCTKFCQNGICMHDDWVCNDINDCGDNSDELHCNGTAPVISTTVPPPKPTPQPNKGDVPGFWLAIMLIIGLIIGILLPFIIPAIYRRMKKRTYNRMTDMDNITADDYTPMD